MRYAGTAFTLFTLSFWLAMNGMLVHRELKIRKLDRFERGLNAFLGNSLYRERWLSIYRGHHKVGFTGYSVEKVFTEEGIEYQVTLETFWRGQLPLPGFLARLSGDRHEMEIHGQMILDKEMQPRRLFLDVRLRLLEGTPLASSQQVFVSGVREGNRMRLGLRRDERTLLEFTVPADDLVLADGLSPTPPLAGYKVGDTFRLHVFDPFHILDIGGGTAEVRVVGKRTRKVRGLPVDVYELETVYLGRTARSFVTASGEIVEQELGPPLNLKLKGEDSRAAAARGIES